MTKCNGTKLLPHYSISLTFWTIFFTENIRYPLYIFPVIWIWGTKYLKMKFFAYMLPLVNERIYLIRLYCILIIQWGMYCFFFCWSQSHNAFAIMYSYLNVLGFCWWVYTVLAKMCDKDDALCEQPNNHSTECHWLYLEWYHAVIQDWFGKSTRDITSKAPGHYKTHTCSLACEFRIS